MKILKFFLIFLLSICLSWGVLTIAGPSVIKYGLESYFDEQVELLGVRVSPNLEIGVREVKFNPKIFGWHSIGNGQVRAVKLKVVISDFQPLLRLDLGPTRIDDSVSFKSLNLEIKTEALFSLNEFFTDADITELKIGAFEFNTINGIGKAYPKSKEISNVEVSGKDFLFKNATNVFTDHLHLEIDNFILGKNLSKQSNLVSVSLGTISMSDHKPQIKPLIAYIENNKGKISISNDEFELGSMGDLLNVRALPLI